MVQVVRQNTLYPYCSRLAKLHKHNESSTTRVIVMTLPYLDEYTHQTSYPIPFYLSPVQAGFPCPAYDYMDKWLDLNLIVKTIEH